MASEVDISNLALGHIGDAANLQSINPPDGSAQSEHAQRFFPIARDSLLEMHDWSFASRRAALVQVTNPSTTWLYCYAQPVNMINAISVLPGDATDDTSVGLIMASSWVETPLPTGGVYTTQPFALETLADGSEVILTNQASAVLRYTVRITDTTKFSPLFTELLSWSLAGMLAGPVMKGKEGASMAGSCRLVAFGQSGKGGLFGNATASDAGNKRSTTRDRQQVAWINGR